MKTYRRDFIKTLGIGFIGTGLGLSLSEKLLAEHVVQSGEITANTKYGKIRGTLLNEVGVFRGIPYAGSDGTKPIPASYTGCSLDRNKGSCCLWSQELSGQYYMD